MNAPSANARVHRPTARLWAVAAPVLPRGGEELSLTQSAISRQIQALEEEIGCTLFLRGTRGRVQHRRRHPAARRRRTGAAGPRRAPDSPPRGRRVVNVTTFASLCAAVADPRAWRPFQTAHPRHRHPRQCRRPHRRPDASEHDVALRYTARDVPPEHSGLLFPRSTSAPRQPRLRGPCEPRRTAPLRRPPTWPATLTEEDDYRPSAGG